MQRLTGLDATFLSLETPSSPMHVASILVADPSTAPDGFSIEHLKTMYRNRLHLAPPFRRRLAEVPFGLHHPVWIEDPDFDLDYHVRHIACPAPGTMAELTELASHLIAIPLDRRHPLWEAWYIEGLEDGKVAVVSKVHHAAIDGASGEELMVAILDLTPETEQKPPPEDPWTPDRVPTDTELVGYAAYSIAQSPVKMIKATRRTVEALLALRKTNRQPTTRADLLPPTPFTAPRTSLNRPITGHRKIATASLSLSDVKMIKNTFGVTVNDVILTLCSGSLRYYFDSIDEHPDRPLVAMVPVSVRSQDKKGAMGNEVSATLTSLATDIDDPLDRLMLVSGGMRQSKEQFSAIGADTLQNWAEFAAPAVAARAARLYSRMKVADYMRPLYNVTISNVPGPPFPLYTAGAQLVATYPVGPIYDGVGINMTVMSYMDSLDFSINVCAELAPEVWRFADGLHTALDELKKLAEEHNASIAGDGGTGADAEIDLDAAIDLDAEAGEQPVVAEGSDVVVTDPAPADGVIPKTRSTKPLTAKASAAKTSSKTSGRTTVPKTTTAASTGTKTKATRKPATVKASTNGAGRAKTTVATDGTESKANGNKANGSKANGSTPAAARRRSTEA